MYAQATSVSDVRLFNCPPIFLIVAIGVRVAAKLLTI